MYALTKMPTPLKLYKADARRAMVRHHFALSASQPQAYRRLRSVQFDPIAPVGCNHDLVMQARVPGYKVGDWEKLAYEERFIYDGWDKMASLVPFEGWPVRRVLHDIFRKNFEKKIFQDHKDAVEAILKEIEERGPLMPKDCEFQLRKKEWEGHWYGPSVTKQVLRALWHTGQVMTAGRKRGQHLYDLAERVVPAHLYSQPRITDHEGKQRIMLERHLAMGLVRPSAPPEVWTYQLMYYDKRALLAELLDRGEIVPVEIEGVKANTTRSFLELLDQPSLEPRVTFIAPLDPFMWDRKMIAHLFDFEYVWEIYTPVAKRRWGYYVLPVLFGDALVARVEFWCRDGVLEVREWHFETGDLDSAFWEGLETAVRALMGYCSADRVVVREHIPARLQEALLSPSDFR